MESIKTAVRVFDTEIEALIRTRNELDSTFGKIVEEMLRCKGKVVLCGMGKSGHVARKISATMASLGTSSFFLHPAEAVHGDLGMIAETDFMIIISHSGETEEIVRLLPTLKIIGIKMAVITSNVNSILAKECDLVQIMPDVQEACNLNLAPTSSTTAVMAYGDALAVAVSEAQGFQEEDFALFHPAGTLGKKMLMRVQDVMVVGKDIPFVTREVLLSEAIMEMNRKRLGVVAVVDGEKHLVGILTDGDLRRLLENRIDMYESKIEAVMTNSPKVIRKEILAARAVQYLKKFNISNYPVVDENGCLIGMLTWHMLLYAGIVS